MPGTHFVREDNGKIKDKVGNSICSRRALGKIYDDNLVKLKFPQQTSSFPKAVLVHPVSLDTAHPRWSSGHE